MEMPPTRPDLDRLIDVALRTAGETQRFDFKETLRLSEEEHKIRLVRAVGSFANTEEGGFILVGISDDRRVIGLSDDVADAYDQTRVHAIVAQYLAPPPAIQVRQHRRNGQRLVVVEVEPFAEIPSVVRQSATYGKEKLHAGVFLVRTEGAQSASLTTETDLRALCDAIVHRRASQFVDLVQKGTLAGGVKPREADGELDKLGAIVDTEWPTDTGTPHIEVAFSPKEPLVLSRARLEEIVKANSIPIEHGFPFLDVAGTQVEAHTDWGWYGRVPFAEWGSVGEAPSYLWAVSLAGAFVDREYLWEDKGSAIPGGVGMLHLTGRIILLLRFAEGFSSSAGGGTSMRVLLRVRANNVQGRYLENESRPRPKSMLPTASSARVEARVEVTVDQMRRQMPAIFLTLMEDLALQFGRRDVRRHQLEQLLRSAQEFLGPAFVLTEAGTG